MVRRVRGDIRGVGLRAASERGGALVRRVLQAQREFESGGWCETSFPESRTDAWGWLDQLLAEYAASPSHQTQPV